MKKLIFLFLLYGCTNLHYNKVATDTNRSERNLTILNQVCSNTFPSKTEFIKGKDSLRIDTFLTTEIKIDSFTHDTTIFKTIREVKTIHRTDTIIKENQYVVSALNGKIYKLEIELNDLEFNNAKLEEKNTNLSHKYRKVSFVLIGLIGLIITYILIKLK